MAPSGNSSYQIIVATSASLVVSFLAVLIRLACRKLKGAAILTDDYLIISALIFTTAIGVPSLLLVGAGLGAHLDPTKGEAFRQLSYAINFLYGPAVTFAKLSILFLYRRILPVKQIFLTTTIVSSFLIAWCVAIICLDLLKCLPIAKSWDSTIPGYCISNSTYTYAIQIPSIAIDLAIILLPLKIVWDCALKLPQKITASAIFMVGFITLAGDIAKTVVMATNSNNPSVTYNQVKLLTWINVEPALTILAACLPVMKPLFQSSQCLGSRKDSKTNSALRIDIEGTASPTPILSQAPQPPIFPNHEVHVGPQYQHAIPLTYKPEGQRYHSHNSSRSGSFMEL